MGCFLMFVLLFSSSTSLAQDEEENTKTLCLINYGQGNLPCFYFTERSLEKLSEETWAEQAISNLSQTPEYFNMSVAYTRKMEMNSVFVLIRYGEFPLAEKAWEIQPITRDQPDGPLLLTIAFAPKLTNHTRYQLRRIINPFYPLEGELVDPECNKSESILECENLRNSKLIMRKSYGNILSLTMSREGVWRTLTVDILSAGCNITCRGEINPCSIETKNMRWDETTEELKIYKAANATAPTYYCARIAPAYHECCMIYTETKVLYPDQTRNIPITFSKRIYLPECIIVLTVSLALIISAVVTIKKLFGKNSYKCWPYYSLGSEDSVDGSRLIPIQHNHSPSKSSIHPPLPAPPVSVEVLLMYPKGNDTDRKLMAKFRYILSFYVSKIWDPLDDLEMEEVSENPTMWVSNILSKDQVKVIMVENSSTVQWFETFLSGRPAVHNHHLDSLFLYTVSVLLNNPYLCNDYSRLFIIRISSAKAPPKTTNVVPCTRYEIPANIGNLITDLVGSYTVDVSGEFKPPLKEIQELEVMVNE